MQVTRKIGLDYGHTLPDHHGFCSELHGHRARVEATVEGPKAGGGSNRGMVYDFGFLKDVLTEQVHDELDHGFALWRDGDEKTREFVQQRNERVLLLDAPPTAETLAQWAYNQVKEEIPDDVTLVNIRWYETPNNWADYPGQVTPRQVENEVEDILREEQAHLRDFRGDD